MGGRNTNANVEQEFAELVNWAPVGGSKASRNVLNDVNNNNRKVNGAPGEQLSSPKGITDADPPQV